MSAGAAASIQARLLALAKARGEDFNLTLNRYALERFLYRLSISPSREHYWLKGALLFDLWFDARHRPTRDADFLGFGPADAGAVAKALAEVCSIEVPDSVVFDPGSIRVEEIRDEARYGGLRVRIAALLGKARCSGAREICSSRPRAPERPWWRRSTRARPRTPPADAFRASRSKV